MCTKAEKTRRPMCIYALVVDGEHVVWKYMWLMFEFVKVWIHFTSSTNIVRWNALYFLGYGQYSGVIFHCLIWYRCMKRKRVKHERKRKKNTSTMLWVLPAINFFFLFVFRHRQNFCNLHRKLLSWHLMFLAYRKNQMEMQKWYAMVFFFFFKLFSFLPVCRLFVCRHTVEKWKKIYPELR